MFMLMHIPSDLELAETFICALTCFSNEADEWYSPYWFDTGQVKNRHGLIPLYFFSLGITDQHEKKTTHLSLSLICGGAKLS